MSETAAPGQVLVLVDGSPGSDAAARAAVEIAGALRRPLAILGVSTGPSGHTAIAEAVARAQVEARERVPSVDAIQSTGEVLDVARRRVLETPTLLVVLGAHPRPGDVRQPVAARIWRMIRALSPPVLIVPAGSRPIRKILFCSGGERFIEEGARFTASLAAALSARVVVFHVGPRVPGFYGGFDDEESPERFLGSNSRLARNLRRQVEIFRAAGADAVFHVSEGDVVSEMLAEIRREDSDLVVVGSSPTRGAIRTYVLGDFAREIAGRSGRAFLVVRSRQPGFWSELWRTLKEGAPEEPEPSE